MAHFLATICPMRGTVATDLPWCCRQGKDLSKLDGGRIKEGYKLWVNGHICQISAMADLLPIQKYSKISI